MIAFAVCFALAQVATDPATAIVDVLKHWDPIQRKRALRKMRKSHKLTLPEWEQVLQKLPAPPLPIRNLARGRIEPRKTDLWTGDATGILETKISLYVPRSFAPDKKWPLLITCHGSGGTSRGEVSQWARIAEDAGVIVLSADEQGPNEGFRGSEQERLTQTSLLRWAKLHLPIDARRVFLAGTSRGGHIAWDVATRHPDHWAGVAPLIGGPRINTVGGRNNLRLVPNLLDVPIRDLQGEKDDPGLLFNLRIAFDKLKKARDAKFITYRELGHSYRLNSVDWSEFFGTRMRSRVPSRIRFWCVRRDQGRHSWLRVTEFGKGVSDSFRLAVKASKWNRLSMDRKKRLVQKEADSKTGSIDVRLQGNADARTVIVSKAKGIRGFDLLLPRSLWPANTKTRLELKHAGKKRKLQPRTLVETFLLDFCDRLELATAPVVVASVRL